MRLTYAFIVAALSAIASIATASEIAWTDLVDESAQRFEDPFRELDYDALSNLRTYASAVARLDDGDVHPDARLRIESRLAESAANLRASGIEPDWLLSQREAVTERRRRAATLGNALLDGENIAIRGYFIPSPEDGSGTRAGYLVSELGMCSHKPSPQPNQLVRLEYSTSLEGLDFYAPVKVAGRLLLEDTDETVFVLDGPIRLQSSWRLVVEDIDRLRSPSGGICSIAQAHPLCRISN